jgi:hypothetical protein
MKINQENSNETALKRFPIKYIRDRAKAAYDKQKDCFICGDQKDLDLHHFNSISQLFIIWSKANNIEITELKDILNCRDDFIAQHHSELYIQVKTLCKKHHKQLHSIFGQHPKLTTVSKQEAWCDKLRIKLYPS